MLEIAFCLNSQQHINEMKLTEQMPLDDLYEKGKAAPFEKDMYFSQVRY